MEIEIESKEDLERAIELLGLDRKEALEVKALDLDGLRRLVRDHWHTRGGG